MSEIEPVALVGTCKSCKFWTRRKDKSHEEYGYCVRLESYGAGGLDKILAPTQDEEENPRPFLTPFNFACNQWELKDNG